MANRITVANVRTYPGKVVDGQFRGSIEGEKAFYIGRPNRSWKLAGSALANPEPLKIDTPEERAANLARYEGWLRAKIEERDPSVIAELMAMVNWLREDQPVTVLCWCKKKSVEVACHGDVVARVAESMARSLDSLVESIKREKRAAVTVERIRQEVENLPGSRR